MKKIMLAFILITIVKISYAGSLCQGTFANPITDVCWSCLFPIVYSGLIRTPIPATSEH